MCKRIVHARSRRRVGTFGNPGKHGKPSNKTEVPRRPLLQALEREADLHKTDNLKFGKEPQLCCVVEIHP